MTLREAKRQAVGQQTLARALKIVAELIDDAEARPLDPCEVLDQLRGLQETLMTCEVFIGCATPTTLFDAG